ncbi:histone deacetylase family protein [Azospirillum sp.]|uniref:histone deacetylase family protein n=1 Tax=Azospirillum sp. TaxID=34012 RepID=UPI003D710780
MRFIFAEAQLRHRPPTFLVRGQIKPCPEKPERAQALLASLKARGAAVEEPPSYGAGPRAAVHSADYLRFLETAYARWSALPDAAEVIIPNVHRNTDMAEYPAGIVGQAGWHMADTACPIGPGTWEAVCGGADTAAHAATLVASGAERAAYALCRPPGHHASRDMAGGFCYINNAAVAAQAMLPLLAAQGKAPRVAVLDVDVHHGNGTQAIFYERDDVLVVSIHGDPNNFYPWFAGYAHERGRGRGQGCNLNIPLPVGTEESTFLDMVDHALAQVAVFGPGALVLSLGFDTFIGDPLAFFKVTTPGFAELGRRISAAKHPTVLVQEGGYDCDALAANLASFLDGFAEGA